MVNYRYFATRDEAGQFILNHRVDGGLCYYVGKIGNDYEVRVIV